MRNLPNTSTHDQQWGRTPDLLILSSIPYPLGYMPQKFKQSQNLITTVMLKAHLQEQSR